MLAVPESDVAEPTVKQKKASLFPNHPGQLV